MGHRTPVERLVNKKKGTSSTVTVKSKNWSGGGAHEFAGSLWQRVENIAVWGFLFSVQ